VLRDLMTAFALLLIIEGLLVMRDLSHSNPRVIRIGGIISMLAGAVLLQFLN